MPAILHEVPSLSKSALLLSPCLAWASPGLAWYNDQYADTSARDRGTEYHRKIESGDKADAGDSEMAKWLSHGQNYLDTVLGPTAEHVMFEVCVGIDWVAGKADTFAVKDRKYPTIKTYQYGTADIVAVLKDGSLYVGDWKTGGTNGAQEQLLSLAAGFQRCMLDSAGNLRKVHIACLGVSVDGIREDRREVPQAELDSHWDAMRFQWEDIGRRNDPVPGIHCTQLYCPHLAYCSAVGGIIVDAAYEQGKPATIPDGRVHLKMTDKPATDAEAGYVMERISAARRQMKYYESAIREYVKRGGRVVSGDFEWRETGAGFRWSKRH